MKSRIYAAVFALVFALYSVGSFCPSTVYAEENIEAQTEEVSADRTADSEQDAEDGSDEESDIAGFDREGKQETADNSSESQSSDSGTGSQSSCGISEEKPSESGTGGSGEAVRDEGAAAEGGIHDSERLKEDELISGEDELLTDKLLQDELLQDELPDGELLTEEDLLEEEEFMVFATGRTIAATLGDSRSRTFGLSGDTVEMLIERSGLYEIVAVGAGGGDAGINNKKGGYGGRVSGTCRLKKDELIYINAGGHGSGGGTHSHGDDEMGENAFNGGGASGYDHSNLGRSGRYRHYGGGGGASDVRRGSNSLDDVIIVAGGGGGGGSGSNGGNAGGGNYNGRRLYGDDGSAGNGKPGGGGGYYGGQRGAGGSNYVDSSVFLTSSTGTNSSMGDGWVQITLVTALPDITVKYDNSDITNGNVRIEAEIDDEEGVLADDFICWVEGDVKEPPQDAEWGTEQSHTVSHNGSCTIFIKNKDGEYDSKTVRVDNIDKLLPEVTLVPDTTEWTGGPVVITAEARDAQKTDEYACAGLAEEAFCFGDPEEDGIWQSGNTLSVSENGVYEVHVRDAAGNISRAEIEINNIDYTAPSLSFEKEKTTYSGPITLIFSATDVQEDGSEGCGLHELPFSYTEADGERVWTDEVRYQYAGEGSFTVYVRDALENEKAVTLELKYDKKSSSGGSGSGGGSETGGGTGIKGEWTESAESTDITELSGPDIMAGGSDDGSGINEAAGTDKTMAAFNPDRAETDGSFFGDLFNSNWSLSGLTDFSHMSDIPDYSAERPGSDDEDGILRLWKELMDRLAEFWSRVRYGVSNMSPAQLVTFSLSLVAALCTLIMILADFLFEKVRVYEKDEKGRFRHVGSSLIIRKKNYKVVDISSVTGKKTPGDIKLKFDPVFGFLHRNEKILVQTGRGVKTTDIRRCVYLTFA